MMPLWSQYQGVFAEMRLAGQTQARVQGYSTVSAGPKVESQRRSIRLLLDFVQDDDQAQGKRGT